ncbi:MAG TPA: YfhO family protein [Thermoanaerobaculia bacterium]
MAALLYLIAAAAALYAWHRLVTPLSRAAAAVVLALPLLLTGRALLTNAAYGGFDILFLTAPFSDYAAELGVERPHNLELVDHVLQLAPWQREVRAAYGRGEWPLWNPSMLGGQVLAGNMQSAPYDPFNALGMLLPLDLATTFGATITLFLAALFAFGFARELDCSEAAAVIAAATFMLAGGMAFNAGWPLGRAWAMLPLVLLGVHRVATRADLAAAALLASAFVLLILVGHPETLLHVAAVGAVYGLFALERRNALRAAALALAAGVVALLVTAIFLLPFLALLDSSLEVHLRPQSGQAPWPEIRRAIRATFLPYYGGAPWHTRSREWNIGTARIGSVALALAAIAALRLWRRREVRFFLGLAIVTLLACWKVPPVSTALHALPLFDIALNERLGIAAVLALALLAAFACDELRARDTRIVLAVAAMLAITTIALWHYQWTLGVDRKLLVAGAFAEALGIALLLLALRRPRIAVALILAAICTQRVMEDGNLYPRVPRSLFYPDVPLLAKIPRDPMYRMAATGNLFVPNIAAMYGLEDVRGYDALTNFAYADAMILWTPNESRSYHDLTELTHPFLSLLGVRHVLVPRGTPPPPGWRVAAEERGTRLLENSRAIPRVFVPRAFRFVRDEEHALAEMVHATDFAATAWIEDANVAPHEERNGEARLHVRRSGGARYDIDVVARGATRVVVVESNWPGWRAYVDGKRVALARTDRAFFSVYVPEGRHKVRVIYLPEAFVRGRAVTFATLALLALAALISRWRRSTPATRSDT